MPLADLPEHVFHRDLRVLEDQRGRRGAADSELLLLGAGLHPLEGALDQERGEMLPVDLGEDRVEVGEAAVRDELLGAVQEIMLPVRGEDGGRLRPEGVAAGVGFREAVGGQPLAGDDLPEVLLLLLLRPVVDEGEGADPRVRGVRHGKSAVDGRLLRRQHARGLREVEAPVLLGSVDHQEAQFPELAQELDHQVEVVVLQFFHVGKDLFAEELVRGVRELKLLVAEILGGEHVPRGCVLDQVPAAVQNLLTGRHRLTSVRVVPRLPGDLIISYFYLTLMSSTKRKKSPEGIPPGGWN